MAKRSHYPSYDVMKEQDHWDDHTRSIVAARLVRERDYRFLTDAEAEVLRAWCSRVVDDSRGDIIQYVLGHIDETLYGNAGESQRKPGVPPAGDLIRSGIAAVNAAALARHAHPFFKLKEEEQEQLMNETSLGIAEPASVWGAVPQRELFLKLLNMTLEAYFSHPTVWSEIGYGGPAYPRGYIRTQAGHLDPWEAKRE
jgi:hypothetical protein